ncbi:T9SS type A sorting domain-containing protein [uncultured Psychroserpens sp.]|uniref:T9SS type A sorting domain-containing protein n=1 Tax=uncultured Psychroserpens sp. TaxID=255436 RepID=UPI00262E78DD|nr:T9SS type A sorting domain-containing protein [uncultured Psychroserpens sp.]
MKKLILLFFLTPFFSLGQIQIGQTLIGDPLDSRFGNKVCMSHDGNVIAISSLSFSFNNGKGNTVVYRKINDSWVQIGQNIVGDFDFDSLGFSASLNNDGSIIVLGAPYNDDNGSNSGHVKVFENSNDTWVQKGQNIIGEAFGDQSGFTVSSDASGNIIAITASFNDGISNNAGHVRVFEFINNTWTQIGQDIEGDINGIQSAWSIDLSIDGNTIAIGSPFVDINGAAAGHVRVYQNINNTWSQIGSNINGSEDDWFGYSLSLSQNGNRVAISSTDSDADGPLLGYIKVYENINNNWIQVGNDITNTINSIGFGWDIEINEEGDLLVASDFSNNGGNNAGSVRIYSLSNDTWSQIGNILGDIEGAEFGTSIELNLNGSLVVVGAPYSNIGNSAGEAKVFSIEDLLSTKKYSVLSFNLFPNPTTHQFTIKLNNTSILEKVTIYNMLGQEVSTSKKLTINTKSLTSATYIVEVQTTQGKASKKLIIE